MSDPQTPEEMFNARRERERQEATARQEALAAAADVQRMEDASALYGQIHAEPQGMPQVELPPDETATPVAPAPQEPTYQVPPSARSEAPAPPLSWEQDTPPQGPQNLTPEQEAEVQRVLAEQAAWAQGTIPPNTPGPEAQAAQGRPDPQPQASLPRPTGPTKQPGAPRRPRAEIARAAAERKNATVQDYWLPITQEWVKVRDLTFSDSTMLKGLPHELRGTIDKAIRNETLQKAAAQGTAAGFSVEEAIAGIEDAEQLAIGICIAGFVEPRLVLHERDLVAGDESVWLVTDIDPTERMAYMNWTNRHKVQTQQGADAAARFPG